MKMNNHPLRSLGYLGFAMIELHAPSGHQPRWMTERRMADLDLQMCYVCCVHSVFFVSLVACSRCCSLAFRLDSSHSVAACPSAATGCGGKESQSGDISGMTIRWHLCNCIAASVSGNGRMMPDMAVPTQRMGDEGLPLRIRNNDGEEETQEAVH